LILHTECSFLSRADGNVVFDTMNLNAQADRYTDQPAVECKQVPVLCLQQLEKDTIYLGLERILVYMIIMCMQPKEWV
jgi:hypothetical protein